MREVKGHAILGQKVINNKIKVEVYDEAVNNANHKYQTYFQANGQWEKGQLLQFHKLIPRTVVPNEIPPEDIPNGITDEVLISIVLDRLRSFQSSELSCRENAIAITKLEESLLWLQKRTMDRIERNVHNTLSK